MTKLKNIIILAFILTILLLMILRPQYQEQSIKAFIKLMECEQCLTE